LTSLSVRDSVTQPGNRRSRCDTGGLQLPLSPVNSGVNNADSHYDSNDKHNTWAWPSSKQQSFKQRPQHRCHRPVASQRQMAIIKTTDDDQLKVTDLTPGASLLKRRSSGVGKAAVTRRHNQTTCGALQ
jgi:hypothetical protein